MSVVRRDSLLNTLREEPYKYSPSSPKYAALSEDEEDDSPAYSPYSPKYSPASEEEDDGSAYSPASPQYSPPSEDEEEEEKRRVNSLAPAEFAAWLATSPKWIAKYKKSHDSQALIFTEACAKKLFRTRAQLKALWGTLVNANWHHEDIGDFDLSFRVVGGLCAEIEAGRRDIYEKEPYAYMDYYCCTREYDMQDPATLKKLAAMGITRVEFE